MNLTNTMADRGSCLVVKCLIRWTVDLEVPGSTPARQQGFQFVFSVQPNVETGTLNLRIGITDQVVLCCSFDH